MENSDIFSHERCGNFYDSSTSVMYRIIFGCPVKQITPNLESTMTNLTSAIWPKLCLLSVDICWHYAIYFSTNFPMTKFLPSLSLLSRCPFGNLLKFGKLYDIIIVYSKGNIFLPTTVKSNFPCLDWEKKLFHFLRNKSEQSHNFSFLQLSVNRAAEFVI